MFVLMIKGFGFSVSGKVLRIVATKSEVTAGFGKMLEILTAERSRFNNIKIKNCRVAIYVVYKLTISNAH